MTAQGEWLWVMGEGKNFKNQEKEKMFQRVCLFKLESNFYIQQSNNVSFVASAKEDQQSNNPAIQQSNNVSFVASAKEDQQSSNPATCPL
ncbi:MAG: hypothetical protein ACI9M9_002212 [Flavobacteriaceae bacterium]